MPDPKNLFGLIHNIRAEAIGTPGQRRFRLIVEGNPGIAHLWLEKGQLMQLSVIIQQMLDDLIALQRATSPDAMEREASRMKRERALIAENARLKQGRVAPQTFDNSQGSAEVTTNQDRLLEAYINGDRSEAAVKAARRFAFGS